MIVWFVGASCVLVWQVFKSPALDYRLVALGSVLPVGEVVFGGPRVLHTLVAAAVVLFGIVLITQKRRLVRRRWIGLPIGLMMHLVLDGIWARTEVFWWPFFGADFPAGRLPELEHPVALAIVLELIGAVCLVWMWRTFDLADPERRAVLLRTGHLSRDRVS